MPEADRVAGAVHFVGDEFGSFQTYRLGPGAYRRPGLGAFDLGRRLSS
jgi:hypothetical protein